MSAERDQTRVLDALASSFAPFCLLCARSIHARDRSDVEGREGSLFRRIISAGRSVLLEQFL